MTGKDQIGQRIKLARKFRNKQQKWVASQMNLSESAISRWENDPNQSPTLDNLAAVSILLDVSFEWLGTGRGPMLMGNPDIEYEAIPIIPPISPEWQETLHGIAELPQDQRDDLRQFIDRFVLKKGH